MGSLADAYAILKAGALWSSTGRCKGYAVANPGEAAKIDSYIAALDQGQSVTPPTLATDTGKGIVGMLAALAQAVPSPTPTPAPTPAPTGTGCKIGAYIEGVNTYGAAGNAPWDLSVWDRFEADAGGKRVALLAFGQPTWWKRASFDATAHNNCVARGAIPLVSYGADGATPDSITSGSHDADLKAMAAAYKSFGHEVWLRWLWEMNQYGSSWFEWAVPAKWSSTQHKAAYQHIVDVFRAGGATNVKFVWCVNFIRNDTTRVQLIKDLFPGETYMDVISLDGYNDSAPTTAPEGLYGLTIDTLKTLAPGKPICIYEIASRDTSVFPAGTKAAWIKQLPAWLKSRPAVTAMLWFNWKITENGVTKDWPIESSADSQAAFAGIMTDPYLVGASIQ